jgi:hypothetical protein
LIDPEDDGGGEYDGGHEGVGASIVAGMDASPIPDAAEHVLDPVTTAVESSIMGDRGLAAFA